MLYRPRLPLGKPLLGAFVVAMGLMRPSAAEANSPYLVIPDPAVAEASPAYRYANMSDAEAFEELDRRKILYSRVDPIPGVRAPIRLTGRLHGVYIHSALPPDERVTSIFEILDARLALALDDFAAVLERHDIDEVVHYTMYRPNVAKPEREDHEPVDSTRAALASPGARRRPAKGVAEKAVAAKGAPEKSAAEKPVNEKAAAAKAATEKPAPAKPGNEKSGAPKVGNEKSAPAKHPNEKSAPSSSSPASAKPAKSTITTKGAFDTNTKKSGREGAHGLKQKSPPPGVAKPTVMITKPGATAKMSPPAARRQSPVASVRPAAQAPVHRGTWAPPGTRHPAGLAIDVGSLHKRDGRWLSVAQHFQGHIGDPTCGEGVTFPATPEANELHSLVCEAYDLGIFTYVLTPNYNEAHADHFHMEIKGGVRWFLYH